MFECGHEKRIAEGTLNSLGELARVLAPHYV